VHVLKLEIRIERHSPQMHSSARSVHPDKGWLELLLAEDGKAAGGKSVQLQKNGAVIFLNVCCKLVSPQSYRNTVLTFSISILQSFEAVLTNLGEIHTRI
jgi:hypothetical protein